MDILSAIGAISGVIAIGLFAIFRKGAQKYVDEKAKNLATIEDTQKITNEVEMVKFPEILTLLQGVINYECNCNHSCL